MPFQELVVEHINAANVTHQVTRLLRLGHHQVEGTIICGALFRCLVLYYTITEKELVYKHPTAQINCIPLKTSLVV
jgi:hypothetical protein